MSRAKTTPLPTSELAGNEKLRVVETYLQTHYGLRFNVVKEVVEWRPAGTDQPFEALDEYRLNSLSRELTHQHHPLGTDGLYRLLASDFTPRVDPLRLYFDSLLLEKPLKHLPGHSIEQLAASVTVAEPAVFARYLTKWLVATVANALTPVGCQNHTCLVLTGGQGQYKTTWLELICPPELAVQYLFTGKIQVESKDTQLLLAEYLFINIDDQLRTLNKQDENSLKTLITQPSVKIRRPYARLIAELPRRASFMGSINGADFLTDPTGSRRFLPFEVEHIDLAAAKRVDIRAVWREAYQLWLDGYVYWFDEEETKQLHERNRNFQHDTPEYDLVVTHFASGPQFLTLAHIKQVLAERSGSRNLRDKYLGEALTRLGMPRQQRRTDQGGRIGGYLVQVQQLAQSRSDATEPLLESEPVPSRATAAPSKR